MKEPKFPTGTQVTIVSGEFQNFDGEVVSVKVIKHERYVYSVKSPHGYIVKNVSETELNLTSYKITVPEIELAAAELSAETPVQEPEGIEAKDDSGEAPDSYDRSDDKTGNDEGFC